MWKLIHGQGMKFNKTNGSYDTEISKLCVMFVKDLVIFAILRTVVACKGKKIKNERKTQSSH